MKIDNSNKISNASLLQQSRYISFNEQSQSNAANVGCIYGNALEVNEHDAHSNEKNVSLSGKDSVSQSLTKEACSKHFELPDGCDPKHNSFIENGVEVSEISNAPEQICVSNKLSSLSVSEVQGDINVVQDSCYSSSVKTNDNSEKVRFANERDSVNAVKSALKTVFESHLVQEDTILLNSSCNKNECFQNSPHSCLDNITTPDTNRAVNFQKLEGIKWDFPNLNLKESCADQQEVTKETITPIPNNATSSPISDNSEQNCDVHPEAHKSAPFIEKDISELEAAASETDEQCSQNNSSKSTSNSEAQDHERIPHMREHEHPHLEYLQPEYEPVSEDDDSGVSSEEGNNSPLFFFNNQMLNCNDGANAISNKDVDLPENIVRSCDNQDDLENRITSSNSNMKLIKEVTGCNENTSELQLSDGVLLSENTIHSSSPNKFTGARPKLDGQISQNPVPDSSNEETEIQIEYKIVIDEYDNSNDTDILQSETEVVSEIYEAAHCDNSDPPNVVPLSTSCNTEAETIKGIESIETEHDNQVSANKSFSADANNECSIPSDLKNENNQQRLSRPTSLDLPSRHLAISQSIGENNINVSGSNNMQPANVTDILSNEHLVEDSASGM